MRKIKSDEELQESALFAEKEKYELKIKAQELESVIQQKAIREYKELKKIQKQLQEIDVDFKEKAMKFMVENDIVTSEGKAGKITRVIRNTYKVVDDSKLPKEYKGVEMLKKSYDQKMKEIKKDFEMFEKPVPGIERSQTEFLKITLKKEEE